MKFRLKIDIQVYDLEPGTEAEVMRRVGIAREGLEAAIQAEMAIRMENLAQIEVSEHQAPITVTRQPADPNDFRDE